MKLMRLLAAGRSVIGIKKDPGPYRMNQENLLPKFVTQQKGGLPLKQPLEAAAAHADSGPFGANFRANFVAMRRST